jgi:hypothetical protein
LAARSDLTHRLRPKISTPVGRLGAAFAVVLAFACLLGCPQKPAGGGGGGAPATHIDAFSHGVGDAYIGAASVHEALVSGNFEGARKLLDGVMHDLQAARGRARTDEQRQILRLEDRGLQLAGIIDQHSPAALAASQAFMDAVVKSQLRVMSALDTRHPSPLTASRIASATPRMFAALRPRALTRVAASWPVRPSPVRRGGHAAATDPGLTRVRLAAAVVRAIHAEQALLGGRMSIALGQVKSLRVALKQAHAKGTPWQRRALTRLDKQANQLQLELAHGNPAAFAHASGLVDASLQVQQNFKHAGGGPPHGVEVTAKPGGGGGKPHAKPGAKKHPAGKGKPPKSGHPAKPHAKPHAKPNSKPHATPTARPRPIATPYVLDIPPPPADPTLDEDHPGALPSPP